MVESIQKKLGRVRAPRVHITYDVEIGDAIQTKELPFVLGVMSDLSGHNEEQPNIKERKFVEIDRDNFNSVMKSIGPKLSITVADKFKGGDSKLPLDLKFEEIWDFDPMVIVNQVESMQKAYEPFQNYVAINSKS